ncbi:nitrite reductase, copper-containing, partial [Neisseria meningitidis]|nr:nitrite reductase, copper-containing [Neisseria meningitidis]
DKAIAEQPEYVVFNGHVGSIAGDNALKAKAGETIRMYVGNGGPNLVSSFHVIGEIFDKVYVEGGKLINENVQSTIVPAGGSAIVEFKVDIPGNYNLVDHESGGACNKGAMGQLKVEVEENPEMMTQTLGDTAYDRTAAASAASAHAAAAPAASAS